MRKLIILAVCCALFAPNLSARPKQKKAGKVQDGTFVDSKYGFSFNLVDDWKYSVRKAKDNFRIVLVKKNYDIPGDYLSNPEHTMVPRMVIWVDTTSFTPFQFLDSILNDSYKSKQRNELRKECDILIHSLTEGGDAREKLITRQRKAIKIDGKKAMSWVGKMGYRKEIATSASSLGGKRVSGDYGGYIVAVKNGKQIMVIHLICEWQYFKVNRGLVDQMISSIKWE